MPLKSIFRGDLKCILNIDSYLIIDTVIFVEPSDITNMRQKCKYHWISSNTRMPHQNANDPFG